MKKKMKTITAALPGQRAIFSLYDEDKEQYAFEIKQVVCWAFSREKDELAEVSDDYIEGQVCHDDFIVSCKEINEYTSLEFIQYLEPGQTYSDQNKHAYIEEAERIRKWKEKRNDHQ